MPPKTVLLTGCSEGGAGFALAKSFQKRGFHVFATARTPSKMVHLHHLPDVTLITLDVTSPSSIQKAVEAVKARTGGMLDYLVNNAGASYTMPALDANLEDGKKMFDVNFWGLLAVTQAFSPFVIASKGTIVNICSIAAHICQPWMGLYSASKAAVEMLSETMRLEMAPLGVRVVSVVTGAVKTNFHGGQEPLKLPPGSYYQAIEATITASAAGDDGHTRMEADVYAEKVVGDLLDGRSGRIWRGTMASMIRYLSLVIPSFLADRIMIAGSGLDAFPAVTASKKAA